MLRSTSVMLTLCLLPCFAVAASAVTVPYTEDFPTGDANWRKANNTAPDYVATGGPSGAGDAYISSLHALASSTTAQTIFRGQDNFNSSGDAFVGDWITGGVTQFSFWIRHNAAVDLTVGTRFATPDNFPGFGALSTPTTVPPNQWTQITFAIDPTNPALQPEGPVSFATVFGNLGNLQILADRGSLAVGTQVTFDLDKVNIVPEPAGLAIAAAGGALLIVAVRRRRRVA